MQYVILTCTIIITVMIMTYKRIRDLREDSDLNQEDIAQYLHMKQNSYSSYETGRRTIPAEILGQLADYYETSVDYLMGRTDEKQPYPKPPYRRK